MGRQEGDCHQQGEGKLRYLKSEGTNGLRGVQRRVGTRGQKMFYVTQFLTVTKEPKTMKGEVKKQRKKEFWFQVCLNTDQNKSRK